MRIVHAALLMSAFALWGCQAEDPPATEEAAAGFEDSP